MILKLGGSGGKIKISDAPKIAYSGKWLQWHLEFYGDELYWEAWFLSSGTLTVEGSYTADAWGVGGGGSGAWSTSAAQGEGYGGCANMATGVRLTGKMTVSIGSAGSNDFDAYEYGSTRGGNTKLGNDLLTCSGGYTSAIAGTGTTNRYRFSAADKATESNGNAWNSMGGWLPIDSNTTLADSSPAAKQGAGIGAGAGACGLARPGALVIRIPA